MSIVNKYLLLLITDDFSRTHVKYEDLVINTEYNLKKLCSFLDLEYNNVMHNYTEKSKQYINKSNHFTKLHSGLTKKVNSDKVEIWKKQMKNQDVKLADYFAGEFAEEFGYKRSYTTFSKPFKLYAKILLFLGLM